MKTKTLILLVLTYMIPQYLSADIVKDYLTIVEKQFDEAKTDEEKLSLISQPLNREYLAQMKAEDEFDLGELYVDQNFLRKTNVLALTIAKADTKLLTKFLSVVDDVNSEKFYVRGYRQDYAIAHMALDPNVHIGNQEDAPLEDRMAIIDLVAAKGADFNLLIPSGHYENPPLSAGILYGKSTPYIKQLRALGILYGGKHFLNGSSHTNENLFVGYTLKDKQFFVEVHAKRQKADIKMSTSKPVLFILKGFLDELNEIYGKIGDTIKKIEQIDAILARKTKMRRSMRKRIQKEYGIDDLKSLSVERERRDKLIDKLGKGLD